MIITEDDCPEADVNNSASLNVRITHALLRLGFDASSRGYEYLRREILEAYYDPGITVYVTKTLYPRIARLYHTSTPAVERAVRCSIASACREPMTEAMTSIFGGALHAGNLRCSELVSTLARMLHEGII